MLRSLVGSEMCIRDRLRPVRAVVLRSVKTVLIRPSRSWATSSARRRLVQDEGNTKRFLWQRPTLPGTCVPSTIGAGGLDCLVRDGAGYIPSARVTKRNLYVLFSSRVWHPKTEQDVRQNAVSRMRIKPSAISTAKLNTLLCLHPPPIQQVVYLRPYSHEGMGDLILRRASHLDAFSGYRCQT